MGKKTEIISEERRMRPDKSEVNRLLANTSLAKELTGWEPRYSLEAGLEKTIAWYKNNLGGYRANDYVV